MIALPVFRIWFRKAPTLHPLAAFVQPPTHLELSLIFDGITHNLDRLGIGRNLRRLKWGSKTFTLPPSSLPAK